MVGVPFLVNLALYFTFSLAQLAYLSLAFILRVVSHVTGNGYVV